MLNLAGRYEKKPASDPDGFLRFAEGLSTPTVYNAIKCAQRLGNIARYSFPASTWRHFEGLASFPRGLIPDMSPCRDTFLPMNQNGPRASALDQTDDSASTRSAPRAALGLSRCE